MTGRATNAVRAGAPALLLAVTLVLTAANLRAAVTSVGAVLREVQAALGMSDALAGVLTTLPVLCFGVVGLLAARLGRRVGSETAIMAALAAVVVGLAGRAMAPTTAWLLVGSLLSLTGVAVGNVLVPVVVKTWFPRSVGRATGWYSMAIAAGTAIPAAVTVPIADAAGGWRIGLAVWALPALAALVPWAVLTRLRRRHVAAVAPATDDVLGAGGWAAVGTRRSEAGGGTAVLTAPPATATVPVHRRAKAWALAAFFGLQSLEAYTAMGWLPTILQDAGVSPARAGAMLGVTMVIGAPISLLLPVLAVRTPDQRPWVGVLITASAVAWTGLILAPAAAPLLWAVVLGIGLGGFPLALVLLALRAATPTGTAALSSLAQGVGYLVAALGPVSVGALRGWSGSWGLPLTVLLVLLVPKLISGRIAAAPGHVDD